MQSKGTLGSIIAGVIAIFLVLVCLFYLSFTMVSSHHESEASKVAAEQFKKSVANYQEGDAIDVNSTVYVDARKAYMDDMAEQKVWLGYTLNEVRRWSIGLGLDLKGGMSVILQVDMQDMLRSLKRGEADAKFDRILVVTDSISKSNKTDFVEEFYDQYMKVNPSADMSVVLKSDAIKKGATKDEVVKAIKGEVEDMVKTSATHVLRNRIDAFGVVSPNIQVLEGKDGQIMLELPGVTDHERMRDLLTKAANLEFYETYREEYPSQIMSALARLDKDIAATEGTTLVQMSNAMQYAQDDLGRRTDEVTAVVPSTYVASNPLVGYFLESDKKAVEQILATPEAKRLLPADVAFRWGNAKHPEIFEGKKYHALYALKTNQGKPAMLGNHVTTARDEYDDKGKGAYVEMRMDSDGAREWSQLTGRNEKGHYPVAIVLDDQVYSAPNVQQRIDGGVSSITGNFTVQDAKDLANVLKSGKMDAKVVVISQEVIGPSLGQQAIDSGIISFIVALVLLMILMIGYYGVIPGLVANFGLILNLFFTFGILSSFQAVLTLSGIAGIVLALGMAVDANVLIFERAKEELRAGKNARTAIAEGYSNAFSAIFDSNLTSIITGVILLLYGTGPIKGFATTLIIGIACSFFTAVYLTRIVFILGAKKKCFERLTFTTKLSRRFFSKDKHINFLGKRKVSFIVAGVMIVIVIASFCIRGLNPGIDFSGGRNYVVSLDRDIVPNELEEKLAPEFPGAAVSVINIENKAQVRVSTNYKIDETDNAVEDEIVAKLYKVINPLLKNQVSPTQFSEQDSNIGIVSSQKVGPTVADDMRKDAYIAVSLALIAMFIYILIRFHNLAFSFGALAAVAFTAFTIVGFYSIFWGFFPFAMEIDQTFIAAILTVIGYQINDTVVVFDRVRENTALFPKRNFYDVINMSINSTLGRTIMTSASTLLVLVSIFVLGGDAIRSFVFAMIFGVIIGTLATIFIAAPVAYLTDSRRKKNVKAAA